MVCNSPCKILYITLWLIEHMHSLLFIRLWRASKYLGCSEAEKDYRGAIMLQRVSIG